MKKAIYYIFNVIFVMLVLGSCAVNQPAVGTIDKSASAGIIISGRIAVDSGRAATASFEDLQWYVYAGKMSADDKSWSYTVFTAVNDWQFTLRLPKDASGEWTIFAGGYKTKPNDLTRESYAMYGFKEISFDTPDTTGAGAQTTDLSNLTITCRPVKRGSGTISLTFNLDTGVTEVVKVIMRDESDYIDASADFVEKSATVMASATAGVYKVTLQFCDSDGNTLYRTREAINVYNDATTDTWSGNSTYLKSGVFTITQDMIDAYGTEIVPNTGTVLYDNWCDEEYRKTHKYYFSNISSSIIDESWGEGSEGDMPPISFTFDNAGNLYVLNKSGENPETGDLYTEIKTNFDSAEAKTITFSDIDFKSITIDRKTNTLYGSSFSSDAESPMLNLYAYPTIISANNTNDMIHYVVQDSILNYYGDIFAINDGEVYIPCLTSNEGTQVVNYNIILVKATLSSDDANKVTPQDGDPYYKTSVIDKIEIKINDVTLDSTMQLTDCIYQDGCVYMLLRESRTYWNAEDANMYSRGAVIKYDCFDGSITTLGWSDDSIKNTEIKKMSLYGESGYIKDLTGDSSDNMKANNDYQKWNQLFPNIYAPKVDSSNNPSTDCFYGPIKFVGIKPKKLVIADDGLAFYSDDDVLKFKNVNRIVTINLENFAISVDPNCSSQFNEDYSLLNGENICNIYEGAGTAYHSLGIPKADN